MTVPRRRWATLLAALLSAALPHALAQGSPAEPPPPIVASADGRYALAVSGDKLTALDAAGRRLREWPLRDARGFNTTVLAVFDAAPRRSFVVALHGVPELWEISYDLGAEPIFDGLVHDYRMAEAIARPGYLGVRRTHLERPLAAVFFDPRVPWLVGLQDDRPADRVVVVHLDIRRAMATLPEAAGLDGAAVWMEQGAWMLGLPSARGMLVWDSRRWSAQPRARATSP